MAATIFSQHSSNPLEVGSSDRRNQAYLRKLDAQRQAGDASSEDPIEGFHPPEMADYHSHVAALFPKYTAVQGAGRMSRMVDLDDDEEMPLPGDGDAEDGAGTFVGAAAGVLEEDLDLDFDDGDDDDADAEGETDEECTLLRKPPDERAEIEEEIGDLEEVVPGLAANYKLVDRLGTGTFSSVYKAVDLAYHERWDNTAWHGRHPPGSSAHYQSRPREPGTRVFVALKRIYVTSNPERIRNEIAIMEDCRACRHVSQLITAFRHHDQVVAVMPYQRNDDFREYFQQLPMEGIKSYFRCMFRALRDIHARAIIHRDIKPANFLFDPRTGIGTICDFGLACRMGPGPTTGVCLHGPPSADHPHGRLRKFDAYQIEHIKKMQRDARQKSAWTSDRVGYPDKDARPHSKANRAGTRGFRAPEVLLKCGEQSGAVDVWAAGVILLFFLAAKFPLFQAGDDVEALMEIAAIIGKRKMEKAATLHSRTFASNVPSVTQEGISWRSFVERQNPKLYTPPPPDPRFYPYTAVATAGGARSAHALPPTSSSPSAPSLGASSSLLTSSPPLGPPASSLAPADAAAHRADVDAALDLAERLLEPEATKRWTPRQALHHLFLLEGGGGEDGAGDDVWFPHPFGEGVCGALHFKDEVTEEPCVRVRGAGGGWEVQVLSAGEGTAIGSRPCEFHEDEFPAEAEGTGAIVL